MSMKKTVIQTLSAPAPIGPYNQAILTGDTLYISGQICLDPQSGELKNKDIQEETHRVMQNLKAILHAAGMGFNHVVKTTIFITDMNRFSEINEVYGKYFEADFSCQGNGTGIRLTQICECGNQHDRYTVSYLSAV